MSTNSKNESTIGSEPSDSDSELTSDNRSNVYHDNHDNDNDDYYLNHLSFLLCLNLLDHLGDTETIPDKPFKSEKSLKNMD